MRLCVCVRVFLIMEVVFEICFILFLRVFLLRVWCFSLFDRCVVEFLIVVVFIRVLFNGVFSLWDIFVINVFKVVRLLVWISFF